MRKKIRGAFLGLPIHQKIILVYGLGILPILLILCVAVVLIMGRVIFNNVRLSVNNNSAVIVGQIEGKTDNIKSCANITLLYLNELTFLRSRSTEQLTPLARQNHIIKRMTYAVQVFKDVDGMIFVDRKQRVYGSRTELEELWERGDYGHLLTEMSKHGGEAVWFPMNRDHSLSSSPQGLTLTMGKNIVDISTGERLGVLFLTLEEESLNKLFADLRLSPNSHYLITTEDGVAVSSHDPGQLGQKYLVGVDSASQRHMKDYYTAGQYMYSYRLREIPYYLLFRAPLAELTQDIRMLVLIIVAIGLLCILIAVMLAVSLARRITRPIIRLARDMDKVSTGNLAIRCANDTQDETHLIADGFNHMLDTIEGLIKNVRLEQKQKQHYELALIQSQIKPHFLYNVLDTIYVLVHMNRNDEAKQTTKALADFYRVALSSGREIITMAEEIKCLEDYLKIQKIRYADDFDYEIILPAAIAPVPILKMLIQPIVENAIYHGLKEKQTKGFLRVEATLHNDVVEIKIHDNGVGIETARCAAILSGSGNSSFGLKNVNDRIRLYYGEYYGLRLESQIGEGCTVSACIPAAGHVSPN